MKMHAHGDNPLMLTHPHPDPMMTEGRREAALTAKPARSGAGCFLTLDPARIAANPTQPRRTFDDASLARLADSIRHFGILQPLTVRRSPERADAPFELIAGERRLRAARRIGLAEVPCLLIEADSRRSAELALIENLQREDLTMFEQAAAMAALIDLYGLTQEEAARRLSASQSAVANKLRLLRLTPPEREAILRHGLTERHARALLRLDEPSARLAAIGHIAAKGLNVAAAESYIERLLMPDAPEPRGGFSRFILKDLRLFYQTVDRAVALIRSAGVGVTADRREEADAVELVIRIPRSERGAGRG